MPPSRPRKEPPLDGLADALERLLTPDELRILRRAGEVADRHGVELYLVGGTVRDILLGQTPADLDLTGAGVDDGFAPVLAAELGGQLVSRSQFGTAHVRADGVLIDLAMARQERYEKPGALPTVSPAQSVEDDLRRRDFSINAMAMALSKRRWGRLVDPLGGLDDLERRRIRVLHSQSFVDDATRIFRAVRYSVRMEFALEEGTLELLKGHLRLIETIGGERVWNELERMFMEKRAVAVVRRAEELGVLSAVVPGLVLPPGGLGALPSGDARVKRLLALMAWPVLPLRTAALVKRLHLSREMVRVVEDAAAVKEMVSALRARGLRLSRLHGMLEGLDAEAIKAAATACGEPTVGHSLRHYLAELRGVETLLRGEDLIELGVPEGPRVGEVLKELKAARLDGLVETREDEERFVRRRLRR
jgi:tRNA nucleotidyltransferase (CCA-adding enzyme)